jgi:glucose/arabinose dehydrogenase
LDELNRVTTDAHFGWPFCIGAANQPDELKGDFDCTQAIAPALTFPTHSTPLSLAAYNHTTFPSLTDTMLVVLGGSHNQFALAGYALAAVHFDPNGTPTEYEIIVPGIDGSNPTITSPQIANYRGLGFWPHRPLGVAVSPQGWVYFSAGDRIYALRPLE